MTKAGERLLAAAYSARSQSHSCNCIGPQIGQPVCPCRMRAVTIENGRYVERNDLVRAQIEQAAYQQAIDCGEIKLTLTLRNSTPAGAK